MGGGRGGGKKKESLLHCLQFFLLNPINTRETLLKCDNEHRDIVAAAQPVSQRLKFLGRPLCSLRASSELLKLLQHDPRRELPIYDVPQSVTRQHNKFIFGFELPVTHLRAER